MKKFIFIIPLVLLAVIFIRSKSSSEEGWRVDGQPVALTTSENSFLQPTWSPDGKKIAMAGPNYRGIWIIGADGQNLKKICDDTGAGYRFSWSNDSKEIAAKTTEYRKRRKQTVVKIFDVITSKRRVIKEYRSRVSGKPNWTSDDQRIYIYTKNSLEFLDSGRLISKNNKRPNTGEQTIFYSKMNEFVLAKNDGAVLKKIAPVDGTYLNAMMSPNGEKIAFELLGGNLYVVHVDGAGLVDLGQGERPCWSPDSEWLAYVIPTDDGHEIESSDIFLIKPDGAKKTNLTNTPDLIEMNPNWSPTGDAIVFDEKKSGKIFKLNLSKN